MPKKYSSRKELTALAMGFALKNKLESADTERLLIEVDRLKSSGNLTDRDILIAALKKIA